MSNDDLPKSYVDFMTALSPKERALLIAALCPNFDRKNARTASILNSLKKKGYRMFFWVIQNKYDMSDTVKSNEILNLSEFGVVEIFSESVEAKLRAVALRSYIEMNVIEQRVGTD